MKSYTCPLNKPAYVWHTQSAQSVKTVVYLRKRSHNRLILSARLCNKLRNRPTCRRSLTQRLVSWSSPVVPKVCIKTQRTVEEGNKLGLAEAIQTCDVFFQRYHCLSVSACCVGPWEKSRLLTLETNVPTCCRKSSIPSLFFHTLFEAWVTRCSTNSELGHAQKCLGTKRLQVFFEIH